MQGVVNALENALYAQSWDQERKATESAALPYCHVMLTYAMLCKASWSSMWWKKMFACSGSPGWHFAGGSSCTASGSKRNLNFLSVLDHRQKIIQRNEQCQNTLEHQLKMSKSLRTWQILHIWLDLSQQERHSLHNRCKILRSQLPFHKTRTSQC